MNKQFQTEQIENEDLSFLIPRLEKLGFAEDEVLELISEYKKYLILRLHHAGELPMYSLPIDKVWHAHILDTRAYREFCDRVYGSYLDHRPYTKVEFNSRLPEYSSTTLALYREVFEKAEPQCWHIV